MKKKLILLGILAFSFVYCKAQNEGRVTIHTDQVEMFNNLMSYSEEKAGGKLDYKTSDKAQLKIAYDKNAKDSRLNKLIDNLLSSDAYSDEVVKYVRTNHFKKAKGKEAYRIAHTVLPDYCINITAGMSHHWVSYWNSLYKHLVDSVLVELKANENEIVESIKAKCKELLPDDANLHSNIDIHIIVDGNRSGFQTGNMIIMDAYNANVVDMNKFINTLTHEMHHVYYMVWLDEKKTDNKHNKSKNYLYMYQKSFIMEGLAQSFNNFSPEVKQMYANKKLITELFDEWILMIRKMNGAFPKIKSMKYQKNEYKNAIRRMEQYYPGKIDSYVNRPTALYYLSYNIYNSIFESGGRDKIKYVIENPETLLSVYNELYSDSMVVPRIPDDVVTIWKNNF